VKGRSRDLSPPLAGHYDHGVNRTNDFGQPVGAELSDWSAPNWPSAEGLRGNRVNLVPLDAELHAPQLFEAFASALDSIWTYMSFGPFGEVGDLTAALDALNRMEGWLPYAITVSDLPVGIASYLRIDPANGVLEIGSLAFSPQLQRTAAATEALYLMIDHCFELGYRRCEWKCDDLNAPSHASALRLGFQYEGVFRQATHYKGRNRDTAWYGIVDNDWPALHASFHAWLSADNFDEHGRQVRSLRSLRPTATI
jgi:RimJ/RimL family protein N-acetyltransferase